MGEVNALGTGETPDTAGHGVQRWMIPLDTAEAGPVWIRIPPNSQLAGCTGTREMGMGWDTGIDVLRTRKDGEKWNSIPVAPVRDMGTIPDRGKLLTGLFGMSP